MMEKMKLKLGIYNQTSEGKVDYQTSVGNRTLAC